MSGTPAPLTTKTFRMSGCSAGRQSEGAGEVQLGDHASRVREAASQRSEREEHDWCVGKQLVATLVDELDGGGLYRDDEVEPLSLVFHAQEITEGRLIPRVRKPPLVDVFGVVVQVLSPDPCSSNRGSSRSPAADMCASRLVEYRTSTCFGLGPRGLDWPEGADRHRDQQATSEGNVLARRSAYASEIDLGGDLEEPWRQDRQRLQPRPARDERVVVGQHRTRVQRVVDVERDQRS